MIRVFDTNFTLHDKHAVASMMDSGFVGPGKRTAAFETAIAEATGHRHAIACNSGTTALMLSLWSVGVKPGGVVICPAYGFHAAANAARMLGANVWLVDVESTDFNIDVDQVTAIDPAAVQAIVVINQNGQPLGPSDENKLIAFAKRYHVPIVEDACQSLGIKGAFALGDVCTLSFSVPKLVTTGQGGAVVTNNDGLATELRGLIDHGGDWRETRVHSHVGGNFRMPDLLAGLGLSQFERLDEIVQRRDDLHQLYRKHLEAVCSSVSIRCGWCVTYLHHNAKGLINALKAADVEATQPYRVTSHHRPFITAERFPQAECAAAQLVYLPSHVELTDDDVRKVCDAIHEFDGTTDHYKA